MLDIKHIARILYDNRTNPEYNTSVGRIKILANNGQKVAKKTFDRHLPKINAEIQYLHDLANQEAAKHEANLEDLFTKEDYILGLRDIWDSPMSSNRDKMQAGELVAKFFGWNAPAKTDNKHSIDTEFIELMAAGKVKVAVDIDDLPQGKFNEIG